MAVGLFYIFLGHISILIRQNNRLTLAYRNLNLTVFQAEKIMKR